MSKYQCICEMNECRKREVSIGLAHFHSGCASDGRVDL